MNKKIEIGVAEFGALVTMSIASVLYTVNSVYVWFSTQPVVSSGVRLLGSLK